MEALATPHGWLYSSIYYISTVKFLTEDTPLGISEREKVAEDGFTQNPEEEKFKRKFWGFITVHTMVRMAKSESEKNWEMHVGRKLRRNARTAAT